MHYVYEAWEDIVTDKEVQKLNRKELLEFLLDAQTENESLQKDLAELRRQVRQLEEELASSREELSHTSAELSRAQEDIVRAKENASDSGAQAAVILSETGAVADDVPGPQREANAVREQRLKEWESRLQQKDELLAQKEAGVKKLLAAADSESSRCIQEANSNALETRRQAEEAAEALRKASEAQAADTIRQAEAAAALVMRNAEEDESVDFLFGGPRLVTDAGGDLSRYYVSGSPQANGAHSARGNRERAEQDWAAKAELVGAALEEAAREGASPTPEYVSAYYQAHHGEHGLGKKAGLGTIRNWLKPGCTSLPFHTEGGVVVPDESGGEGQQEAAHGRAPL